MWRGGGGGGGCVVGRWVVFAVGLVVTITSGTQ